MADTLRPGPGTAGKQVSSGDIERGAPTQPPKADYPSPMDPKQAPREVPAPISPAPGVGGRDPSEGLPNQNPLK